MRFLYAYKTADGIRHEDAIDAPSRGEAFAALRVKGIRPIKVVEVRGGSLKRWVAISSMLVVISVALAVLWLIQPRSGEQRPQTASLEQKSDSGLVAKPRARKQLPAELFAAASLERTFLHPSERVLARFARPGVAAEPIPAAECILLGDDFLDALDEDILLMPDDSSDTIELKRVIAGIKLEAKMLVASGRDFAGVIAYFAAQQSMEAEYRRKVLDSADSDEEKARQLTALGL